MSKNGTEGRGRKTREMYRGGRDKRREGGTRKRRRGGKRTEKGRRKQRRKERKINIFTISSTYINLIILLLTLSNFKEN